MILENGRSGMGVRTKSIDSAFYPCFVSGFMDYEK